MTDVYIAIGSNIEPVANLARAITLMRAAWPDIRFSSAYRNAAAGFEGDDFINLAASFTTTATLAELLVRLHTIEHSCGREREAPKWAPRAMDLDVLLYGELVGDFPGAVLPRPDLLKRPYMLGPMAELAGNVRHPVSGLTMADHWQRFDRGAHAMQLVDVPGLRPAPGSMSC